jgi:hypothetical protein
VWCLRLAAGGGGDSTFNSHASDAAALHRECCWLHFGVFCVIPCDACLAGFDTPTCRMCQHLAVFWQIVHQLLAIA